MIIAEIGTSHGGSIQKAEDLVTAACKAGCDAVKFQWVYADEILHPDTGIVRLPGGSIRLYDRFKSLEVPFSFFERIKKFAHSKNVQFICSPFGKKSLAELLSLKPDAVKIASPEVNHFPMLNALAEARKKQVAEKNLPVPVILSGGVTKLSDIEKALDILNCPDGSITLLHCITSYPAPEDEYNVKTVKTLHNIFGIPTGISDHSLDPVLVPVLAVAQGSVMTEKHITLSRDTDGLDDPVALEPEQFALMVHAVHQAETIMKHYGEDIGRSRILEQMSDQYGSEKILSVLGTGIKKLAPSELQNYGRTNRSIHFLHAMKKGTRITSSDIAVLRTEKILSPGISPEYFDTIQGAILQHDVKNGAGLRWDDIICKI